MTNETSLATKIAYCLVVLGATVPFGLAASGWVKLAAPSLVATIPFVGPCLLLAVGLYRVVLIIRNPGTLNAPYGSGFIAVIRSIGLFFLYVGALFTVIGWLSRPLTHSIAQSHSQGGMVVFMLGVSLAFASGLGILGLVLFELSRLRSFEREAAAEV